MKSENYSTCIHLTCFLWLSVGLVPQPPDKPNLRLQKSSMTRTNERLAHYLVLMGVSGKVQVFKQA